MQSHLPRGKRLARHGYIYVLNRSSLSVIPAHLWVLTLHKVENRLGKSPLLKGFFQSISVSQKQVFANITKY